jgi:hypothetical protein
MAHTISSAQNTPQQALMQLLLGVPVVQMIATAVKMGIPKILATGPHSATLVAKAAGTLEDTTYRLMRALSALGILHEQDNHKFSLTEIGEYLRPDVPGSYDALVRFNAASWSISVYSELMHSMETGESAFAKHHGESMFTFLSKRPEDQELFGHAMSTFSGMEIDWVLAAYDFEAFTHIIDIGGSLGMLISRILQSTPNARGTLFDVPAIAHQAKTMFIDSTPPIPCECIGGDFFESIPTGGDLYLLKHILHDWEDERALRILHNVAAAMKPGARLLVIEQGICAPGIPNPGKIMDVVMLALTEGGRERSAEQFANLFNRVGIRFEQQISTSGSISLFEGVRD